MKDEITIKELAPYLPYGLKVHSSFGELATISSVHLTDLKSRKALNLQFDGVPITFRGDNLDTIKPILRPLSDLTKEIEYKDRKYCVMSLWYSVDTKDEWLYETSGLIPEYWKITIDNIEKNGFKWNDYGFVNLLFEHHFDVFGLIPKELAIDINTIK